MHFKSVLIAFFFLVVSSVVLAKEIVYETKNLPESEFVVTKSLLNSDDEFMQKVSKELGKVSDDVRFFMDKVMRVAKTLLRDWILKNDDGSDARGESDPN